MTVVPQAHGHEQEEGSRRDGVAEKAHGEDNRGYAGQDAQDTRYWVAPVVVPTRAS